MADDPSRLWHLSDSQLVAHFNLHYPQAKPWRLVHPRPEMISSIHSALRKQRPDLPSLLKPPPAKTACGRHGKPSFPLLQESTATSTPCRHTSTCLFSKYLPKKYGTDAQQPAKTLTDLGRFRITHGPSPRRSVWDPSGAPIPALGTSSPWSLN